jgi:hypothetical protein
MVWDATSIKELMFCPRRYQYSIVEGYRGGSSGSIHLEFGILAHKGKEVYDKAKASGVGHIPAQLAALEAVFEASFAEDGTPWRGVYEPQWHCNGERKYKNAKGNAAKCPYSHKGKWFLGAGPETCGECGSTTTSEERWLPYDKYKDRYNLMRLVYQYTEDANESPWTVASVNGKPAVELHFNLPLPWTNSNGEQFGAAGYIDSVKIFDGHYLTDLKTTTKSIGEFYFDQYSPNVQVDWYDMTASWVIPGFAIEGIVIEAAQLLVDGVRFTKQPIPIDPEVRKENVKEVEYWLSQAEAFARSEYWPKNKANCAFCHFKSVCKARPDVRQGILESNFERVQWDPTKERT